MNVHTLLNETAAVPPKGSLATEEGADWPSKRLADCNLDEVLRIIAFRRRAADALDREIGQLEVFAQRDWPHV